MDMSRPRRKKGTVVPKPGNEEQAVWLDALLKARDLTNDMAAELCSKRGGKETVSAASFQNYRTGQERIRGDKVALIAEGLNIPQIVILRKARYLSEDGEQAAAPPTPLERVARAIVELEQIRHMLQGAS